MITHILYTHGWKLFGDRIRALVLIQAPLKYSFDDVIISFLSSFEHIYMLCADFESCLKM